MIKQISIIIGWCSIWLSATIYLWYDFTISQNSNNMTRLVLDCLLAISATIILIIPIIYKIIICITKKNNETQYLLQKTIINIA